MHISHECRGLGACWRDGEKAEVMARGRRRSEHAGVLMYSVRADEFARVRGPVGGREGGRRDLDTC